MQHCCHSNVFDVKGALPKIDIPLNRWRLVAFFRENLHRNHTKLAPTGLVNGILLLVETFIRFCDSFDLVFFFKCIFMKS